MIERIIAWTATQNGHRVRLRYIGTSKNNTWLHNRCAALNLRTLIKRGLTCRSDAPDLGEAAAMHFRPTRFAHSIAVGERGRLRLAVAEVPSADAVSE